MSYGQAPQHLGVADVHLPEYMNVLYMPICMGDARDVRLPPSLECTRFLVTQAMLHGHCDGRFVYITAKRGYAVPDNPLNRPGWHCDGFGSDDLNFVWYNRFPTRYAIQEFQDVSGDHDESMRQFESQIDRQRVTTYPDGTFLGLDAKVVHTTPQIKTPGERQFIKISISNSRYNLEGNAHNHLFDYRWNMFARSAARNHPVYAGRDYFIDEGNPGAVGGCQ